MEDINEKLYRRNKLREELLQLERSLATDMKELETEQLGMPYYDFIRQLKNSIKKDNMVVEVNKYHVEGNYTIEDVVLNIRCTIYGNQDYYSEKITYLKTGREVNTIPKKYEKQKKELVDLCFKQKINFEIRNLAEDNGIVIN